LYDERYYDRIAVQNEMRGVITVDQQIHYHITGHQGVTWCVQHDTEVATRMMDAYSRLLDDLYQSCGEDRRCGRCPWCMAYNEISLTSNRTVFHLARMQVRFNVRPEWKFKIPVKGEVRIVTDIIPGPKSECAMAERMEVVR
jgi:hypothetical protein